VLLFPSLVERVDLVTQQLLAILNHLVREPFFLSRIIDEELLAELA